MSLFFFILDRPGGSSQYTNSYIKSKQHYFLYKRIDLILEWGEKVHQVSPKKGVVFDMIVVGLWREYIHTPSILYKQRHNTNSYIKSKQHHFLYKRIDLILEWGEKVH